jgi:hypothetical protein
VEYLPETGMPPHHKSIKSISLIDCLNTIEQLIGALYTNYHDLKLWITTENGTYRPAIALNDPILTTETDEHKINLATQTSAYVKDHIAQYEPQAIQTTGYFLANLVREIRHTDQVLPVSLQAYETMTKDDDEDDWEG